VKKKPNEQNFDKNGESFGRKVRIENGWWWWLMW
jgi:hypothetical protein